MLLAIWSHLDDNHMMRFIQWRNFILVRGKTNIDNENTQSSTYAENFLQSYGPWAGHLCCSDTSNLIIKPDLQTSSPFNERADIEKRGRLRLLTHLVCLALYILQYDTCMCVLCWYICRITNLQSTWTWKGIHSYRCFLYIYTYIK